MFKNLDVFRLASASASHAATHQAVVAQNIANADTPDYKARDVVPFSDMVNLDNGASYQRATRDAHLNGLKPGMAPEIRTSENAALSPNGNNVSIEEQMANAVNVKRQHDRALAIYKSSLTVLRSSLGRR